MLKPFPISQKERRAISSNGLTNNKYHSHFYHIPAYFCLLPLLLWAVPVSGVLTSPPTITPSYPSSTPIVSSNDTADVPSYVNHSWWPRSIHHELFNSNRGTLKQQSMGVPPSWGVGCPTPGSTPPIKISPDTNNNKLNYLIKREEAENDHSPYYSCPAPCPLTNTINNILNNIQQPSTNNNNKNEKQSSSFNNNNYNNNSSTIDTTKKQEDQLQLINNNNNNNKHPPYFNQCLHYLQPSVFETLCKKDNQSIYEFGRQISKLRLPFCCEHTVESVMMASLDVNIEENDDSLFLRNSECIGHLSSLLSLDKLARKAAALFDSVLERYDCGQAYSVHFHCDDCKDAYRRWVCASLLPYHEPRRAPAWPSPSPPTPQQTGGQMGVSRKRRREWRKVRPCRSVCQQVEQRCPFFLPGDRAPGYTTQYAGEPTFLCLDPNIPETGEQYLRSAYGPDECCFRYCDTAESIAAMRKGKHGRLHGVCSTTSTCDQQELLLNLKHNNNNLTTLNTSNNLLSSSSSTSNNNNIINNNNNNNINNNKINNKKQQCSELSTNEEKVQCATPIPRELQKSVNSPPDDSPAHNREEQTIIISSGDVIRSAGVSFHIHYLTALVARQKTRHKLLLLLLFSNNDINNNNINRISPSLMEWWWFSILNIILRIINLSSYFLALLPYMLLFLLVHARLADGYL